MLERKLGKYNPRWIFKHLKPSFYRAEDCVFYHDGASLSYENVLISLTETSASYGLRWWDRDSWEDVDTPAETRNYGFSMWRGIEDPEIVYLTGHESSPALHPL